MKTLIPCYSIQYINTEKVARGLIARKGPTGAG